MITLNVKFSNQLYIPCRYILKLYAQDPLALDPESNTLLHQLEGLVLHANHFGERNSFTIYFTETFRDVANSIKHTRSDPTKQVDLQFAILYEHSNDSFKFVRNTVIGQYPDGRKVDVVHEVCAAINQIKCFVASSESPLMPLESSYEFYDWAFAYSVTSLSVITTGIRTMFTERIGNDLIPVDVENIRIVVLDEQVMGKDPKPHFPQPSAN